MGKSFRILHYTVLLALFVAMFSCSKDSTEDPTPPGPTPPGPTPTAHKDEAINKKMDAILRDRYFWNEEYLTLTPNYAQSYDTFLPSLLLDQMRTNIFDRKSYGKDSETGKDIYRIYSYVVRSPLSSAVQSTRGVNHGVVKEAKLSFGIVSMRIASYQSNFIFVVEGVYPASPAAEAGIKRGFIISMVNGQAINNNNYESLYYSVTKPKTAGNIVLKELESSKSTTLAPKSLFENPLLKASIVDQGGIKVGYIVYQSFDAAYDDELLAAIKILKDGGAREMILDLRLNGGGHVVSSNMLSTCIAGAACNNKVYQYYKYNATRMANPAKTTNETGNPYDSSRKYFYEKFIYGNYYGVDLRSYVLNMPRVFVLVSSGTASASEAVINALKGIDLPVTVIGEKTNGKNVGMETVGLKDDLYKYTFAPITFQGFNAKEVSVDYLGMTPDYAKDDWNNGLVDFGTRNEPLFATAMSLITGVAPVAMETRSNLDLRLVRGALPTSDLSRQGMIQLPPVER